MILTSYRILAERDPGLFCRATLKSYKDANRTTKRLLQIAPAIKQERARQISSEIGSCISQADELFTAAAAVSLRTKPLLIYYAVMNLAAAMVLLREPARWSLRQLREVHGHHGLELRVNKQKGNRPSLEDLNIKPVRNGTFAIWQAGAHEYPLIGEKMTYYGNNNYEKSRAIILTPDENLLGPLRGEGISLADALALIPALGPLVAESGRTPLHVRSRISIEVHEKAQSEPDVHLSITLHPGPATSIEKCASLVRVSATASERLEITEYRAGFSLKLNVAEAPEDRPLMKMPQGVSMTGENTFFCVDFIELNEFGVLMIALYAAGIYSRYYADYWSVDVAQHSEIASFIERLCEEAVYRAPLLALSELSGRYHAPLD
ncbi:YaaC family protein [Roseiterribacter gracilis]|uniref:Uncharacterized protein n=1 Tax=Roseiterribacter gracilis TaxID=2812848 RepID=A0A8S8XAN1_9PROT|nr:hypothetical protein TMPK1_32850 [Rhodospirillales bacterium TMPK1]